MEVFAAIVFAAAVLAGGVAAVAGFGIGSPLTPLFALGVWLLFAAFGSA